MDKQSIKTLVLVLIAAACQSSDPSTVSTTTSTTEVTTTTAAAEFDDHTVSSIDSVEVFEQLARVEGTQAVVKFAIPDLAKPGVVWMDSSFYELHDEWYWYRLLNGERVPGIATEPPATLMRGGFANVDDVYTWAEANADHLPLDLTFASDGRLYSAAYYELALTNDDKTYGLGSVIRFQTVDGERWVMQLEFGEATTAESVGQFFDRLSETLPSEIADRLEWVPRSPHQAQTVRDLRDLGDTNADRVVSYTDLISHGEVTVYNPGITAGRLRLIDDADDLNNAGSNDILVMEAVPEWLPPATAILTASPQTPLAHVNLLARNRGIPNVSIGGLMDNRAITNAARLRAYAVVQAGVDGAVQITLITEDQFKAWNALRKPDAIAVSPVDIDAIPTVLSLTNLASAIQSEADVAEWRPIIGGKSAGFLSLITAEGVTTPDTPLAITVAPYFRHLVLVEAELDSMLANAEFRTDARIRFLLLEGAEEFAEVYTSESDAQAATDFAVDHPAGAIGAILEADGFMNLFRDVAIGNEDLDQITEVLQDAFAPLSELQGLRFRSSSSVEDLEGFTGAGLYDSNTGFLYPEMQADEKDHKKSVERTIKKTWASYWSFEAFEERRLENVDHRSGGMGVTVHPRFDDPLEVDNGVATLMLLPQGSEDRAVITINVQAGDVSVANPDADSGVLPEQIVIRIADGGALDIERVATSTLVDAGGEVMDDESVVELVGQLESVAQLWRARVNADLVPAQQLEVVTLDFEFKHMAAGWPALADGSVRSERLVVKQARSLDPGLRGLSAEVLALPIPRDVLVRAAVVQAVTCGDGATGIEVTMGDYSGGAVFDPVMRFSDTPDQLVGDDCTRTTVLSTPEQMLVELLASGEGLVIG